MTGTVSVGVVARSGAVLHMGGIDCDTSGSLLRGVVNLFVFLINLAPPPSAKTNGREGTHISAKVPQVEEGLRPHPWAPPTYTKDSLGEAGFRDALLQLLEQR